MYKYDDVLLVEKLGTSFTKVSFLVSIQENLESELYLTAHLVEDFSLLEQNLLTHYQIKTAAGVCLDSSQRILRRMPWYLSVLTQWQQEKVAHHHNLHWPGFTIRGAMLSPYLAQQKPRISTRTWELYLWNSHQRRWPNSSPMQLKVMSTVTVTWVQRHLGRTLRPLHCHPGKPSSPFHFFGGTSVHDSKLLSRRG